MNGIAKTFLLLIFLYGVGSSQTFDLTIQNQNVSGTELTFDIYMLRTGAANIYLGNCDFVLTFNHTNFTNPTYEVVTEGLTGWYTFASEIVSDNRAVINLQQPPFSNQSQFDARVQVISNAGNGTLIASMKITGITNPAGTAGILWRTIEPNKTIVNTLANTSPWNSSDISANGTYGDPSDITLPVTLSSLVAIAGNTKVTLKWSTQSEVNNAGFEVYRSLDENGPYAMISTYESLASLVGAGNSNETQTYQYEDLYVVNGTTYWYKIADVDFNGVRAFHGPLSSIPTGNQTEVTQTSDLPTRFMLHHNYPNPFNPTTTIRFELPDLVDNLNKVELLIFNSLGVKIRTLYSGPLPPAVYEISWDGRNDNDLQLSSGIYFVYLKAGAYTQVQKMSLVR